MKAIDFNLLKRGELYTIAGGPGYTIPFGLYKCDGYGATEGDPIQVVDALELVRCSECVAYEMGCKGMAFENDDILCQYGERKRI